MKKFLITLLVLGILGGGGYAGYRWYQANQGDAERVSSTDENAVYVNKISEITGYGAGTGLLERFGGEVEPQATLEVKLESDRTVKECFVKEGDEVQEGQRLFSYETQDDEDKLAQAQIDIEKAEGDIEVSKQEIAEYEKERANADSEDQLMITTNILTAQNDIKRSEYDIKTNQLEIEQLEETIADSVVTAEMAGIVQKIADPNSDSSYSSSGDSAYITILAAGDYRIKGTLNEQNMPLVSSGMPMVVHSRLDDSLTWRGTVTEITDSPEENSDDMGYYGYGYGEAGSSNYAFYVELESSEGLLLGQHVYMEPDAGQTETKEGLWLEDYYIIHEDDKAYVWLAGRKNVIEKHEITLGEYDEDLMEYEVTDGLGADDYIAYPMETIAEGDPVIYNDDSMMIPSISSDMDMTVDDGFSDEEFLDEEYPDEEYPDEEFVEDDYSDDEFVEDDFSDEEFVVDDYSDEDYSDEDYSGEEYLDEDYSDDEPLNEDYSDDGLLDEEFPEDET